MNKSKILKRSLAMVLSVLMIVAMIPLSASAADVPAVTKVTLNTEDVTVAKDMSVSLSSAGINAATDIDIVVVLAEGKGMLYHDTGMVAAVAGQYTFNPTADEFAAKKAEFSVWDDAVQSSEKYTISWSYTAANADNAIASVGFTDTAKQYGAAVVEDGILTITSSYAAINPAADTLTLKHNAKAKATSATAGLTVADADGTAVISGYAVGTAFQVTITAENGAARTYSIKVVSPKYFPTFAATGERKAAVVDEDNKVITLNVPYEVDTVTKNGATFYAIPVTFTTGYPSATVKTVSGSYPNDATPKAFTTGSTLYIAKADFDAHAKVTPASPTDDLATLTYSYPTGGDQDFKVLISKPDKDPKAEITALRLGTYNATISGTNITVELPASYMDANATASLKIAASKDATVQIVGSAATVTGTGELVEQDATYPSNKESAAIIRVISGWAGDGSAAARTDYTLTVKKVAISESATLKAFKLNTVASPAEKPYEATFDNTNNLVKISVPYDTDRADLETKWKLWYEASNGAVIDAPALVASGDAIDATTLAIFPSKFDGKTADGAGIVVKASDNTTKTYKVVVSLLPAETGKTITSFGVTDVTTYAALTDSNVYKTSVSGTDIIINVPNSVYTAKNFAQASKIVPVIEVSKGATVYYATKSDKKTDTADGTVVKMAPVLEDTAGTAITVQGDLFDGTAFSATDSTLAKLTLVVASQGASELGGVTKFDANWKGKNAGLFTVYTLSVKQQAANKEYNLKSVSLFDNVTKETVTGTISGNQITFKSIPYHFIADSNATGGVYLNYEETLNASVAFNAKNAANLFDALTFDDDGHVDVVGTEKKVVFTAGTPVTADVNALYIESEDGLLPAAVPTVATSSNTLPIGYDFAAAEKGATLTSMTINNVTARPDSSNKISFTLPYGTEITALKPTWVASKFATVTFGGAPVLSGEVAVNFTADQKFVVVSEDGSDTTTYTVSVTVSDQFTDVKTTDWFYNEVMEAAAKGIVLGQGNGIFNPKGLVTRGQFAQFMARADGYNKDAYIDKTPFSDVTAGTEQAAAIAYCSEKKYINGKGDTTFGPNDNITREQMAVIMSNFLSLGKVESPKNTFADDAQISSWAKGYVYAVYENGSMSGVGGNKFNPKGTATRAEAAAVAVRSANAKA